MAREISIVASVKDLVTPSVTTIRNSLKSFNKDAEEAGRQLQALEKKQEGLRGAQEKLKNALDGLSKSLQEAKRDYTGLDDALGATKLEGLRKEILNTKDAYRQTGDEIKRAKKEMSGLADAQNRAENRAGGLSGSAGGLAAKLNNSGLWQLAGDTLIQSAGAYFTSAHGTSAGNLVGSVLSGAASGAEMGAIGGAPGALIGGLVGAVSGGIQAKTQEFQAKDEAFKSVVQEQVREQISRQEGDLAAGSEIAAGRETSLIAFSTLFGDRGTAESYLEEMKDMANATPLHYDDLAAMSKTLKTYGYSVDELLPQLAKIGDAGAALGLSASDMRMVATGLGEMKSSGKVSLESVDALQDRGIDAVGYLAEGLGTTKGDVYAQISKNLIDGAEAAEIISRLMGRDYGGGMEEQAKSFSGLGSTLQGMEQEMQAAMGEGYNAERKAGIQAQIDYLSGESGEKMSEANRLIGQWKASLENDREELIRKAEREAMESEEYQTAIAHGKGAEAGKLLAAARIKAQGEYNASEGAQLELEMQKSLIESTRDALVEDKTYWDAGYVLGQEYSKGIAAALHGGIPAELAGYASDRSQSRLLAEYYQAAPGKAFGMAYIPRDDYLARLHEGERVLTASEARALKEGGGGVTVQMNGATIREEADVYKIAQALAEEIRRAQLVS